MHIVTTDTPAKLAGEHITLYIDKHDGDIVCLLSGGSALDIIEFISPVNKSECRTIFVMGDERGSRDATINNSLQLQNRYPKHFVTENLILTVPEESENLENFTSRISHVITAEISKLKNPKIIQVLGVGLDGHTAGIFPLPEVEFAKLYGTSDTIMVPIHLESLTIDSRASLTPTWIQTKPDEIIGYITGTSKQAILESLVKEIKQLHERPAELLKHQIGTKVYTDLVVSSK